MDCSTTDHLTVSCAPAASVGMKTITKRVNDRRRSGLTVNYSCRRRGCRMTQDKSLSSLVCVDVTPSVIVIFARATDVATCCFPGLGNEGCLGKRAGPFTQPYLLSDLSGFGCINLLSRTPPIGRQLTTDNSYTVSCVSPELSGDFQCRTSIRYMESLANIRVLRKRPPTVKYLRLSKCAS